MSSKTSSTVKRAHSTPNTERGATRTSTTATSTPTQPPTQPACVYVYTFNSEAAVTPTPAYILEVEPDRGQHPQRRRRRHASPQALSAEDRAELREVLREAGWYGLAPGFFGLRARRQPRPRMATATATATAWGSDPDFPLDSDFAVEGDAE